jgi:RNA polymerase sigma factor (sigma-70 family)
MERPTFESIVQAEGTFIRGMLGRLGVGAAQEVLRAVERGLPAFDPSLAARPEGAVRAWLFGICERQAANHRRRRHRRELCRDPEQIDRTGSSSPNAEEQWLAREREALLSALLEHIEPERRAFVVAHELEGVAMADLAVELQIPVSTAWTRLRLAREDLRAAWRRVKHRYSGMALVPRPQDRVRRDGP